ncbi:TPKA [Symbiodinium natans]|uniref:TPKA protein n=1 Tax=Symbiodinium natans TaxID=878477 RepID=A0A812SPJ8_9DINO|nr:TPKA [Symbiodinium natans]
MGLASDAGRSLALPHGAPQRQRPGILLGQAQPFWLVELKSWLWCSFLVVSYFVVGILFYSHVETKLCESEEALASPDYDAELCVEPWTSVDSLYFAMVSMSTVGYGDFAPASPMSRAFTLFYIVYGITVPFASLASQLATVMDKLEHRFLRFLEGGRFTNLRGWTKSYDVGEDFRPGSLAVPDGDTVEEKEPPHAFVFYACNLFIPILLFTTWQLLCATVFVALQDMSFLLALYHCVVTATTVGYGDIPIAKDSRFFAVVHVAVSVALLGSCVAEIPTLMDIRRVQTRQSAILKRKLDADMILALDRNGDGVDKLEFCIGILIEIGAELAGLPLEWEDIAPFIKQFEDFDVDHSGHLSKEDLVEMADALKESHVNIAHLKRAASTMSRFRTEGSQGGSSEDILTSQDMAAMIATTSTSSSASRRSPRQGLRRPRKQEKVDRDPIVEETQASVSPRLLLSEQEKLALDSGQDISSCVMPAPLAS